MNNEVLSKPCGLNHVSVAGAVRGLRLALAIVEEFERGELAGPEPGASGDPI